MRPFVGYTTEEVYLIIDIIVGRGKNTNYILNQKADGTIKVQIDD